jgi:hypothetical protein
MNVVVAGDLETALVRRITRQHIPKFQYCFEKQLLANPQLVGGDIELAYAIQSSGVVASPTVAGTDAQVATCMKTAAATMAFPAPLDGNQVQVRTQLRIRWPIDPDAPIPATRRPTTEWTPFAIDDATSEPAAATIEAVKTAVTARMPEIEGCFDGARGAVRAMIAIDATGAIKSRRAGGIGDASIETCIATKLAGFTVAPGSAVEVACDVTRGTEVPLRVSSDAGYLVLEVTRDDVRFGRSTFAIPSRGSTRPITSLTSTRAVLVLANPDATGAGLEAALFWAPAGTTLVAVKAAGGAPVFLGMGDSRAQRVPATTKRVVQLRTDRGKLRACIPGEQLDQSAPLLDPRAVDRVLGAVVAACAKVPCEPVAVVGTSGELVAKDLVATTSAAQRAGLTISIGGPACD